MVCTPPVSCVHGISQARILEWAAISLLRDLPNPEIEPAPPTFQADSLSLSHQGIPSLKKKNAVLKQRVNE